MIAGKKVVVKHDIVDVWISPGSRDWTPIDFIKPRGQFIRGATYTIDGYPATQEAVEALLLQEERRRKPPEGGE